MGCKNSKLSSTAVESKYKSMSCKDSLESFLAPQAIVSKRFEAQRSGEVDIFDILVYGRLHNYRDAKAELVAAGWPSSLAEHAPEAFCQWIPRSRKDFQFMKLIGEGSYSSVYKARDNAHKSDVALKRAMYDRDDPESIKFMAREIVVLRRLNHPNIIKLQGLIPSHCETQGIIYLIFEYMEHDLHQISSLTNTKLPEPEIKSYMQQLFKGLEHCHGEGIIHRDIKGSNLVIDKNGTLKIADFGLASVYDPKNTYPLTSRAVALWYRSPELLLSTSHYGPEVDLWSCGCLLGELFFGHPILRGKTEIEQLHKIFKLCGSPPENYWEKLELPNSTLSFKPRRNYSNCIAQTFEELIPPSAITLMETLLSLLPSHRGTASSALSTQFFKAEEAVACDASSLPKYQPCKEIHVMQVENCRSHRQVEVVGGKVHKKWQEFGTRSTSQKTSKMMRKCDFHSKRRVEFPQEHKH